jgi:hypothetical protein
VNEFCSSTACAGPYVCSFLIVVNSTGNKPGFIQTRSPHGMGQGQSLEGVDTVECLCVMASWSVHLELLETAQLP